MPRFGVGGDFDVVRGRVTGQVFIGRANAATEGFLDDLGEGALASVMTTSFARGATASGQEGRRDHPAEQRQDAHLRCHAP